MATTIKSIRITGYSPVLDHSPGEAYYFEVNGERVRMENWSTPTASGCDYYEVREPGDPGNSLPSLVVDEAVAEVMDSMAEAFEQALAEQYAERSLDAQITAAQNAALAAVPGQSVEVEEDEEEDQDEPTEPTFVVTTCAVMDPSSGSLSSFAAADEADVIASLRDNYDGNGEGTHIPDNEFLGWLNVTQGLVIHIGVNGVFTSA